MVPTERPAAQPGQVGGSSRQHCESAVCHRLIRIISISRRCGSSGGWGHEGARCRPRSASDVPPTRINGCSVVQLSHAGIFYQRS